MRGNNGIAVLCNNCYIKLQTYEIFCGPPVAMTAGGGATGGGAARGGSGCDGDDGWEAMADGAAVRGKGWLAAADSLLLLEE
jgi:hypothetical protein